MLGLLLAGSGLYGITVYAVTVRRDATGSRSRWQVGNPATSATLVDFDHTST
jgi:hypothetical protein